MNEDPEVAAWLEACQRELAPMIAGAEVVMGIVPAQPDPLSAIEIGYALLLDKPLILVVAPGAKVPDGLVLVSAGIVEMHRNPKVMARRVERELARVTRGRGDDQ